MSASFDHRGVAALGWYLSVLDDARKYGVKERHQMELMPLTKN
jgi:hypothetical protein